MEIRDRAAEVGLDCAEAFVVAFFLSENILALTAWASANPRLVPGLVQLAASRLRLGRHFERKAFRPHANNCPSPRHN